MSREADLYVLDEPIGGVDQQRVIIFCGPLFKIDVQTSSVLISTHLIADIEQVLMKRFSPTKEESSCMKIRLFWCNQHGKSIDEIFRDQFRVFIRRPPCLVNY